MKKYLGFIFIFIALLYSCNAQSAYRDNLSEFTKLEYDYYSDYAIKGNSIDVNIQDQYTEALDVYLINILGETTLSSDLDLDGMTFTVTSATGATVGDAVNIKSSTRFFQSIVTAVDGTTITIGSPSDVDFKIGAVVEFGEWNMSTANGSVTPVIFEFTPPVNDEYDFYEMSVNIEDNAVMYEGTFGGITALTNGLLCRIVDGFTKNFFLITNNAGFREYGFDTEYPPKVPSGTYAFWANKRIKEVNGVSVRLVGSTADTVLIIVRDDLTGLTKMASTIHGHVTE